jgi:hypothetical protein
MIQKLETWLFSPPVKSFVTAHPFLVWAGLTLVLTSLILLPVMRKWPKRQPK